MKKNILEKIKDFETIIILRHVRPDPDAVGSQAAMKVLINSLYPEKAVYLGGENESSLAFLAEMDAVPDHLFSEALIIVCDTANRARIDDQRYEYGKELIKIDHHPIVDEFGTLALIDEQASSTCELLFELFLEAEKEGAELSAELARLLYAGIAADTGRFRFSNTSERTFLAAARLVKEDFSREELYNELYKTSLPLMRLEGYVLSHAEISEAGTGHIFLSKETLEEFQVSPQETSLIINTFSALEGLKAWVFFVEEGDLIRVRLRSKGPKIHKLAETYRGGGHPMASGATVYSWEEAEQLLTELKKMCQSSA
ncbi:DHH family phosphoesterase [Salisediminibacterium halotolerans]|uniref:Phosphoesterase RecJ domain-containing protein n=1 Tax=Salisediminibacterium halotolerans TaxID=517425 RepID=A0A1H9V624_9BACI|nr:bifunctional oligoribonuclease/PAP phosphatase NrnA [Salisediminibacterium haloalkalitolerans]SES16991.1 phosphoesterase RecJ domain-containing protein [Salisediminibacterium haloalkalitolerans]